VLPPTASFETSPVGHLRRVSRSRAAVAVLGATALLAGCGDDSPLATVAGQPINRGQVDALVEHGREEARAERRDYPERGSAEYRDLEQQALAILVSRAQIVEAAKRLGVTVTASEVRERVALPRKDPIEAVYEAARRQLGVPEPNEKGVAAKLLADAVRIQLTLQKVEAQIGERRLPAWAAKARRLPVEYAAGWEPAG
jgi:hypothetical protein